ncbi:MAG TPA: hypothetical protein VHW96_01885 [Solirubrobacteraceae bacterium]|jgi:hypothetical protein|nr:hypothetical protein [Solirubrobacteraceae bacterium]
MSPSSPAAGKYERRRTALTVETNDPSPAADEVLVQIESQPVLVDQ